MMFVLHTVAVVDMRGLTAVAANPYMNHMHGRIAESENVHWTDDRIWSRTNCADVQVHTIGVHTAM